MTTILDVSALLAWLRGERGAEEVAIQAARMNGIDWREVVQKAAQHGVAITADRQWSRVPDVSVRCIHPA